MKRLASILFALLLCAWTHGIAPPSAIVNMGGGPNLIQRSLFSTSTPTLPFSSFWVPGNGSPALSTSDYYLMNGIYWSRPFDLDTMGSEGAAIKAREGMRYVWMMGADHPLGTNFQGSGDFYVGYSNDPQIWPDPTTVRMLRRQEDAINVVDQNGYTQNTFLAYQTPHLVYNPDSAGDKFYIYAEGQSTSSQRQHELTLFTTSDFLTTTLVGPTIPTGPGASAFNGWTSFGKPQRLGVNNWVVYSNGTADGLGSNPLPSTYKYTSTDGWVWTADLSKIIAGPGPYVTISGQEYFLTTETGTVNDYVALLAVDANKQSLGTYTRISTAFGPSLGNNTTYPWQTWLQNSVEAYEEDGVASVYVTRGFFNGINNSLNAGPYLGNFPTFYTITGSITSNVMTVTAISGSDPPLAVGFRMLGLSGNPSITSFGTGSGGLGTYNVTATSNLASTTITMVSNGSLWNDFIDQYYLITDATAAASAAPLGVRASCAAGLATVQWNNSLPHQNYRVYYGSSSSQTTPWNTPGNGDVTGTTVSFTPSPNAQTWIKVVTLNGGEQKSRVVNTYCSANTEMVNRHINRVLNDGGSFKSMTNDVAFLASADTWLTSNNTYRYLNYWTDVRFGVKESGGFITKIYDLGTTLLPRGGDYTPTTSKTFPSTTSGTTYAAGGAAGSFRNTTPSWINSASSPGYFGNGRANIIQRWNEITLLAAYQKPGTAVGSLFGDGQFGGMFLQHASGSSGNVTFGMAQDVDGGSTFINATVPFTTASAAHVAAGVFDGTNLTAYLDGTAGTPQSATAYSNPTMASTNVLRGMYRSTSATAPVLCSGTSTCIQTLLTRAYGMANEANFTGAGLAGFQKGLPAAQIQSWGALYN